MKIMVIDIGSNTVKYDVFDVEKDAFTNCEHHSTGLGFISYINEDGVPSKEGVSKLCAILEGYEQRAEETECDRILLFATASLRRCKDPQGIIEVVCERTGLNTVLFDGETEAKMSLLGVLATHRDTVNGIMADMGGGSTELNVYKNRKSTYLISNPFGALSLKNDFVKGKYANGKEIENIYEYARDTVKKAGVPNIGSDEMFIVGGSARAIGAICVHHQKNGKEFTPDDLADLIVEYTEMTEEKATLLKALIPGRDHIIIPAITAFKAIADVLGIKKIKVAIGGIREGYMYSELIGKDL